MTVYVDILASALAGLQLLLDVDAFVLGGGLSNVGELYRLLPTAMQHWLLPGAEPAAVFRRCTVTAAAWRGAITGGGIKTVKARRLSNARCGFAAAGPNKAIARIVD